MRPLAVLGEMVFRRALILLAALLTAATDAAWAALPRTPAPEPLVSKYKPGTIVVRIRERRLYHLTGPSQAVSYSIGAARPGIQFYGRTVVTQKREQALGRLHRDVDIEHLFQRVKVGALVIIER